MPITKIVVSKTEPVLPTVSDQKTADEAQRVPKDQLGQAIVAERTNRLVSQKKLADKQAEIRARETAIASNNNILANANNLNEAYKNTLKPGTVSITILPNTEYNDPTTATSGQGTTSASDTVNTSGVQTTDPLARVMKYSVHADEQGTQKAKKELNQHVTNDITSSIKIEIYEGRIGK